jgi:membrane protease YdiL (CAAX protease family)
MRALRAWLLYLLLVFVGGALLAPGLYWLAQGLAFEWPVWGRVAANPFHRYVHRSLEILSVAGLWPLLHQLRVNSWRQVGWVAPRRRRWQELGHGLALGFLTMAVIAGVSFVCGTRTAGVSLTAAGLAGRLGSAALTAVVVAGLEETLFRGVLFGTLKDGFGWAGAALFSGLVFAAVHFFEPVRWSGPVGWTTGLAVLARMFRGWGEWHALMPGFFNLTLVGILLAVAFHRTGALYFPIGLHASWVVWIKLYGYVSQPVAGAGTWACGSDKLVDGWLAWPVLLTALWALPWLAPRTEEEAG